MLQLILCVAALRAHARQPRGDRSAADGARAAVVAGCAGDAAVALNRPALEAPCGEPTSRGACGNGTSAG